ncbi:MAG TPA: hypothetical protein VHB47_18815 [Thermoanaerobaculia bacterium]|jgi:hypothetical protein|nr:hypothetical protein [Thermoanaerobaculia bacterium]
MWIDELVPAVKGKDFLLDTLSRLAFTDSGESVNLGPADRATLGLLSRTFLEPRANLLLQLPRGKHEVAILCGLFARLALLVASRKESDSLHTGGPVVVVGMNTMVHERLRRISLAKVPLSQGLVSCRLRCDGRLVNPLGVVSDFRAHPAGLVYLNTRVGWPRLPLTVTPAVVVIDRTSFASVKVLESALTWAGEHRATTVIVVSDLGDELAEKAVSATGKPFLVWPWSQSVLAELTSELGEADPISAMSMNALCHRAFDPPHGAVLTAAAIDEAFRRVLRGLSQARKVDAPWPRPLQLVRRLTYGLAQLVATVDEYNQWAALDYRTMAFSSIVYELEGRGYRDAFSGPWKPYGETRWAEIRLDVLHLYELIREENPKIYGLAYALDRVAEDHPDSDIIIRVPNEASALAVETVLGDLLPERAPDGTRVRCVPWSERLPWARQQLIEIHPAAPPPSRLSVLWSAESTYQLYLSYPFEVELLNAALARISEKERAALSESARLLSLGRPPSRSGQAGLDVAFNFHVDERHGTGVATISLDVDTDVLFEMIGDDVEGAVETVPNIGVGSATNVDAQPLILEPDGSWWWNRQGRPVEALVGDRVIYLGLDDLRAGMVVVVPRGEGREELFGRMVAAAHRRGEMQAFEVLFRRWRDACWTSYRTCGDWGAVEIRMRAEGSTVTRQSPRTWAVGTVIAPDDPEDIARIGRISGDRLIEVQYRRLAAMADQVRGLHTRLGQLLSAAMSEALDRGGPNLDALSKLLGADASELLDEFELRTVRTVGAVQTIPLSDVRRLVVPPR